MWQTAIATAVRNQRSNLRAYPWTFTFGHIIEGGYLVLISYFSYYYLIRGELDAQFSVFAGSSNYLAYVIIGGALSIFSTSMIMNVSRALMTEWREGTLEALLLSPPDGTDIFWATPPSSCTAAVLNWSRSCCSDIWQAFGSPPLICCRY